MSVNISSVCACVFLFEMKMISLSFLSMPLSNYLSWLSSSFVALLSEAVILTVIWQQGHVQNYQENICTYNENHIKNN